MPGSTHSPLPSRCSFSPTRHVRRPSSTGCSDRAASSPCRPGVGEDERWSFEDDLLTSAGSPRLRALQQPFDRADDVADLLQAAGFADLQVHQEETEIRFASKQQWWDWHWSFSVRGLLEQLEPEAVVAYRDACFREMDALETDGGYPLELTALIVTGRR